MIIIVTNPKCQITHQFRIENSDLETSGLETSDLENFRPLET